MNTITLKIALATALAAPTLLLAAGTHEGGHGQPGAHGGHDMAGMHHGGMAAHASAAGRPGEPAQVTRTIPIQMGDTMRFTPADITVKAGETIRFFVVNQG
ncbi:hypothetical protein P3G55_26760, partial [Leptospira sp. 96542]|nr:hypothetical protein [Leptospira sp. 96542]